MTMTGEKQRPLEIRMGNVKAVAWRNETDQGPRHDVRLLRIYKDADGQWGESDRLGRGDLLQASRVLEKMAETLYGDGN